MLQPSAAAPKSNRGVQSVVGAPPQARAYSPGKPANTRQTTASARCI